LVNYEKKERKKRMCDRNLSAAFSKENGNVISEDDRGKLSWDHKHVLVLDFLDHGDTVGCVVVIHLAYSGRFFAKGLGYFTKVLSFCMKMQKALYTQLDSCLWLYI
jgi:hypothetical protein